MKKNFKLSFKQLTIILVIIFLIIMSESIKYLLITKNIDLASNFVKKSNYQLTEQSYILLNMMEYFFVTINFVILALFTYVTRNKVKISRMYKAVYAFLIFFSILYKLLMTVSGYNYISIILQIILLLYVINLNEDKGDKYE